jgi:glycosyltransferase involved in cell wall biosynthesis
MRIVVIAPDLNGRSGWSRYAADLARSFTEQGHEVLAIVWKKSNQTFCPERALLPAPMAALTSQLLRVLAAWKLKRALKKYAPDVVHFMAEPYALLLTLLGTHAWKSVMTVHGSYAVIPLATKGPTGALAHKTYAQIDHIISVSNFTQNYVHEKFSKVYEELDLDQKIIVIPNGVRLTEVPARRHEKGPKRIIGVGAVKNRKGFLEAVDACAEYTKGGADFRYDIIGTTEEDPGYVQRLRERIRMHGLENNVFLRGSISEEELQKTYQEADLYLMLSLHDGYNVEGFGLVFLEANARGIPVIGPNTGGCPEAIDDRKSGYVCNPTDAKGVAEKMRLILEGDAIDPKECRGWAEEHNINLVAKQILGIYRQR